MKNRKLWAMTAILAAMLTAGCGTVGNTVSVETSTTENSIAKTNNAEESITGASNTEENIIRENNTEENTFGGSSTQEAQDAYLAFIEDLEEGEATVTEGENYGETGTPVAIPKGAETNGFRLFDVDQDGQPELVFLFYMDASEHYDYLSYEDGVLYLFDSAGRRAIGWQPLWHVKDTPYYITYHENTQEFHLCTLENGRSRTCLSFYSPDSMENQMEGDYENYTVIYSDGEGKELSREEFTDRFRELTGYEIGNFEAGNEFDFYDEDFLEDLSDATQCISTEEMKERLKGATE